VRALVSHRDQPEKGEGGEREDESGQSAKNDSTLFWALKNVIGSILFV